MGNKLSYSSAKMYSTCGQKYKLHYVDKLREKVTSGALLFGTAIDEALNAAAKDHKEGTLDPTWNKYFETFNRYWELGTINKKEEALSHNTKIVYAKSDLDIDLLSDFEKQDIQSRIKTDIVGFIEDVLDEKANAGWAKVGQQRKELYNYINWLSLKSKGHYMLKAYKEKIFPQIKRVLEVQTKVELDNEEGDGITGFIDLVVEWHDGQIIVFDNKTSSRRYEEDAVRTSQQLALYKYFLSSRYPAPIKAGYVIMYKLMQKTRHKKCSTCGHVGTGSRARTCDNEIKNKRCPGTWLENCTFSCNIEVMIDDISPHVTDLIVQNFDNVNRLIKTGIYAKNLDSCKGQFGLCPYYNLCWKNSLEGLEKVE